ncbi:MAG: hypothetical protein K8T91_03475 [Planctomycetes bacterium]|nr:hypothetical protein [Planctomycetota bacterium]
MDFGELLNAVPLWMLFFLTAAISLVGVELGNLLANASIRYRGKESEAPLGSLVGAVLGLLAFILAFTFGITTSRFDTRRQLVLDEALAVRTTYLRAGLLPSSQGLEIRRLLREYVEVRLKVKIQNAEQIVARSEELQRQLWHQTESLMKEDMDSEIRSLFVASLNEVIQLHESRKTVGLLYRIPGSIWLSLYLLSFMSMLCLGYQTAMAGSRRLLGTVLLAAAFSLVVVMIADVDRPGEGRIRVSQQPIADVQQQMLKDSP